jgi:hypothetical protein
MTCDEFKGIVHNVRPEIAHPQILRDIAGHAKECPWCCEWLKAMCCSSPMTAEQKAEVKRGAGNAIDHYNEYFGANVRKP